MKSPIEYIVSYGSLLSEFSRKHHSGIYDAVIPVTLHGWRRAWCTRYLDENATYAGAYKETNATISAVLIPTQITDELRERERYYDFVRVNPNNVHCHESVQDLITENEVLWICETRKIDHPTNNFPLPQSYVDTCIIGSKEIDDRFAKKFIEETIAWNSSWVNDRGLSIPMFPRAALVSENQQQQIDQLLDECGVLQHRFEP